MFTRRPALLAALMLTALAAVSACAAVETPPEDESYVSDTETSAPVAETPGPLEPDTTLVVSAVATAANGAQLDLELRVHQSYPWDDIATQTLPAAMTEDCPADLDARVYASGRWSFTRVNISAVPTAASTADWPADAPIGIAPSATFAPIAARGFVVNDATVGAEVPLCRQDKFFNSAGNGGIAIGIPQDTPETGAVGGFTKWANHRFGFDAPGITLTDCAFQVLPLGEQYGASAAWSEISDGHTCSIGAGQESKEY